MTGRRLRPAGPVAVAALLSAVGVPPAAATLPVRATIQPGRGIAGAELGMTIDALRARLGTPAYCEYGSRCVWLTRRGGTSLVAETTGGVVRRLDTFSPAWRTPGGAGVGTTLARLRAIHPGGAARGLDRAYEIRTAGAAGGEVATRFLVSVTGRVYAVDMWDAGDPDLAHGRHPAPADVPAGSDLTGAAAAWGPPAACDPVGRCSWWSLDASDTVAWASFDPAGRSCRVRTGAGSAAPPACGGRVPWLTAKPGPPRAAVVRRRSIAGITLRMSLAEVVARWGPPLPCAFGACTFTNPARLPEPIGVAFGRTRGLLLDGVSTSARTWRTTAGGAAGGRGAPLLREFPGACHLTAQGQPRIEVPSDGGRTLLVAPLNGTRIESFDLIRSRCFPACRATC